MSGYHNSFPDISNCQLQRHTNWDTLALSHLLHLTFRQHNMTAIYFDNNFVGVIM